MAEDMKETLKTERKTEKGLLYGLMAINTLEAGEQISNMELESFTILRTTLKGKVNG